MAQADQTIGGAGDLHNPGKKTAKEVFSLNICMD